ncbi:hypothetical protein L209DRAFT_534609 [Thermothelomyces heterothallicus CBS 203.75]
MRGGTMIQNGIRLALRNIQTPSSVAYVGKIIVSDAKLELDSVTMNVCVRVPYSFRAKLLPSCCAASCRRVGRRAGLELSPLAKQSNWRNRTVEWVVEGHCKPISRRIPGPYRAWPTQNPNRGVFQPSDVSLDKHATYQQWRSTTDSNMVARGFHWATKPTPPHLPPSPNKTRRRRRKIRKEESVLLYSDNSDRRESWVLSCCRVRSTLEIANKGPSLVDTGSTAQKLWKGHSKAYLTWLRLTGVMRFLLLV